MSIITVSVTRLFPFRAWADGKTNLKAEACDYGKVTLLHFQRKLVVFGQSQCTWLVGQSEQTVLVDRRGFVEKYVFERGGE